MTTQPPEQWLIDEGYAISMPITRDMLASIINSYMRYATTPHTGEGSDLAEVTTEDIERWKEQGKYYGYPQCCIDYFVNNFPNVEDTPTYIHKGTGFIPCPYHQNQIIEKEATLGSLIKNRHHPLPFPRNDEYFEAGEGRSREVALDYWNEHCFNTDEGYVINKEDFLRFAQQFQSNPLRDDGWVSCEDRLPEFCDEYLVRFVDEENKQFHEVGYFDGSKFNTAYNKIGKDLPIESATHWQPLPHPKSSG